MESDLGMPLGVARMKVVNAVYKAVDACITVMFLTRIWVRQRRGHGGEGVERGGEGERKGESVREETEGENLAPKCFAWPSPWGLYSDL